MTDLWAIRCRFAAISAVTICAVGLALAAPAEAQTPEAADDFDAGEIYGPVRPDDFEPDAFEPDAPTDDTTAAQPPEESLNDEEEFGPAEDEIGTDGRRGSQPRRRRIIQDGDLTFPREPEQPLDGEIDVGEPEPVIDGTDTTRFDTRPQEDIDLFRDPPAGFDPLLFQIEDVQPLRDDRRPRRLFEREPYDPVGIKVGSFVLFPEIETGLQYDSNVTSSSSPDPDIAYTLGSSARLVSNWSRHALEFNGAATLAYFDEFDSENENGFFLEARGRLDFTRRTNLQALISHDLSQESRSAIDASDFADRTDVTTQRAALSFNHRFNRLRVQLRGSFEREDVGDDQFNGTVVSNDDRDTDEWEQAIRASWEFKPNFSTFAEVAFVQREFGAPASSDNIQRDSSGERYRFGVDFGDTGEIVRGEISVGYGIERPDSNQLADVEAFLFDANASWRVTELTTLLLNARTEIDDTTTAGSGGVATHFIGLEARHAFRRHLIGTAGASISTRDFDGTTLQEDEWNAGVGLEYFFNRNMVLFGDYLHTDFSSNAPGSGFVSDEIFVGLRLRR